MLLNTYIYDNFSVDSSIISIPMVIWALYIGFILSAVAATVDKFYCNRFIKALVRQGAVTPESALPLRALNTPGKEYIRFALRPGKHLIKMVSQVEKGEEAAKYYLPEEKRVKAELRYENSEHPIRILIISIIALTAAVVFIQTFLPELLTMLDNMITQLKNS